MQQFNRYLRAIEIRLEKIGQNPNPDTQWISVIEDLWKKHEERLASEGILAYMENNEWQNYRWMLEEFRVSLFAQSLKTQMPVSEKRLQKQWVLSLEA